MKLLDGNFLAGFIKARQAKQVRRLTSRGVTPKLVIIRDSDDPVIIKYVGLKQRYGADIGVEVTDSLTADPAAATAAAGTDPTTHGIIVQLPLKNPDNPDDILAQIPPTKDVDGLNPAVSNRRFYSATATAINWLLAGYNIDPKTKTIAIVGRGRLVGKPLAEMWQKAGLKPTIFHRGSNLADLKKFDLIVTATGSPQLIKSEYLAAGAVVVDAGAASEHGRLIGDLDEAARERDDLAAITPKFGGVGPLTVAVLFDQVITAAEQQKW